ncbi:glycerol-3-phosphate dehydrogenase/oxidase [Actinocatenispora rupis]|uniref:glycerol-3-phosphate dehydrogenase/oxidase n=1 Tax=Actinocatenispora rupis TaxID=519421 RepID=UPI001943168D|nr:glycerol-3-phosphate dehydrogenase/oxidase [Actinocatenispora rupis]
MDGTWLSAARRERELADVTAGRSVDVVVVGGGVVGAGAALDAASRGLSVVLLERGDLACGTSGASSKLVHGGLRYLAAGDVELAWESARERQILMDRVAPHLVRTLPFVTPYGPGFASPHGALATFGTHLADGLRRAARSPGRRLPAPRRIGPGRTRYLTPALRSGGLDGAVLHWDGQLVDDARLVVALARTAAGHGARILTRCTVDCVSGGCVTAHDTRTGEGFEVRARVVVNATGVWAGHLDPTVRLRPSKGAHVVLRADTLGVPHAGLNVAVPGERNRYVIVLPEPDGTVYVGLTDDPVDGPVPDGCTVADTDVDFLLGVLATALDRPVDRTAVVGGYAGMRPLVDTGSRPGGTTADLSRRHVVTDDGDGLVTVVGGKLTTYRRMAADAVDRAVRRYGLAAGRGHSASVPLVGAAPPDDLATLSAPRRLIRRYGTEAPLVAALADRDPGLLRPVAEGVPVLGVELLFGALAEGALDPDDLLARRTRCALVAGWEDAARPTADAVLFRATAHPTAR